MAWLKTCEQTTEMNVSISQCVVLQVRSHSTWGHENQWDLCKSGIKFSCDFKPHAFSFHTDAYMADDVPRFKLPFGDPGCHHLNLDLITNKGSEKVQVEFMEGEKVSMSYLYGDTVDSCKVVKTTKKRFYNCNMFTVSGNLRATYSSIGTATTQHFNGSVRFKASLNVVNRPGIRECYVFIAY